MPSIKVKNVESRHETFMTTEDDKIFLGNQPYQFMQKPKISGTISVSIIIPHDRNRNSCQSIEVLLWNDAAACLRRFDHG
jgi:hypothetical protein